MCGWMGRVDGCRGVDGGRLGVDKDVTLPMNWPLIVMCDCALWLNVCLFQLFIFFICAAL